MQKPFGDKCIAHGCTDEIRRQVQCQYLPGLRIVESASPEGYNIQQGHQDAAMNVVAIVPVAVLHVHIHPRVAAAQFRDPVSKNVMKCFVGGGVRKIR